MQMHSRPENEIDVCSNVAQFLRTMILQFTDTQTENTQTLIQSFQ